MIRFLLAKASAIGFTSGSSVAPKRSLLSLSKKQWIRSVRVVKPAYCSCSRGVVKGARGE